MSKPTLFFSHSSKDKDLIKSIKDKLTKYTGGVLEIFMSSDGQSIPFGTNWIHKIEEGLNSAKIMFVFVTEKSISSGWIYFEAGFAYSKGIHVIPVGIGVDIGALKAPLNLLQGFNIVSADSLNNFISIINKEFDYKFDESFDANDYHEITNLSLSGITWNAILDKYVRSINYKLLAEYSDGADGKILYDLDQYFEKIITYLEQNNIPYSLADPYHNSDNKCIAVYGIKIIYEKDISKPKSSIRETRNESNIQFSVSPYNFDKSFDLYREISLLFNDRKTFLINIRLNDMYSFVSTAEDCAALLAAEPEWFSFSKNRVGTYECSKLNLKFYISNRNLFDRSRPADFALTVIYEPQTISTNSIVELVSKLYELKIIRNSWEALNHA